MSISRQDGKNPTPVSPVFSQSTHPESGTNIEVPVLTHEPARCIGCGLCALACDKQKAIAMQPVPDYRVPYKSWLALVTHRAPRLLKNLLECPAATMKSVQHNGARADTPGTAQTSAIRTAAEESIYAPNDIDNGRYDADSNNQILKYARHGWPPSS